MGEIRAAWHLLCSTDLRMNLKCTKWNHSINLNTLLWISSHISHCCLRDLMRMVCQYLHILAIAVPMIFWSWLTIGAVNIPLCPVQHASEISMVHLNLTYLWKEYTSLFYILISSHSVLIRRNTSMTSRHRIYPYERSFHGTFWSWTNESLFRIISE